MGASPGLSSLLWFIAIVAMIPLALWLLKRTHVGGASGGGLLRHVAMLPLSASQRIAVVEVGQGEARRWLVLGVTPGSITTLHTLEPQAGADAPAPGTPGFAQLLARLAGPKEGGDAR
ncbi:MAG: flagellar biosynthetic protein FliO [Piscinibacter sp.]|uniref:FliO/MopB family protein n=1 Tax=Piscinibacter TaxID=1114981 RepID=UPI000FDE5595|nr:MULTISPECIES: flagellar biosynthetic protein FliO [Piscinibacter]MCW5666093.1 flagellar biosynthetic protein FliO [Piscinibacter sp.]